MDHCEISEACLFFSFFFFFCEYLLCVLTHHCSVLISFLECCLEYLISWLSFIISQPAVGPERPRSKGISRFWMMCGKGWFTYVVGYVPYVRKLFMVTKTVLLKLLAYAHATLRSQPPQAGYSSHFYEMVLQSFIFVLNYRIICFFRHRSTSRAFGSTKHVQNKCVNMLMNACMCTYVNVQLH